MSAKVTFDTTELFSFLDRLSGRAGKIVGEILLESAIDATSRATELAPIKDGLLRASIHWETTSASSASKSGKFKQSPKSGEILVGSNLVYAAKQEFDESLSHPRGGQAGFLRAGFEYGLSRMSQRLAKLDLND